MGRYWRCRATLLRRGALQPAPKRRIIRPPPLLPEAAMNRPAAHSFAALALLALLSAPASHAEPAPQGSTHLSNASGVLANGSARVMGGALESVAGAGSLVVLKAAGKASSATLALSGRAARDASLVVGASVEMVALSTGYLLVTAGRVLAFIPNEAGRVLLHSSRIEGGVASVNPG